MKRKKGNIRTNLCALAVIPLLCLGAVTVLVASVSIYTAMAAETRDGLRNLANALYQICDAKSGGSFAVGDGALMKDGQDDSGDFSVVDNIKKVSGVDATIFYGDRRLLTSVRNADGTRAVGTRASEEVAEAVLKKGEEYFSPSVMVNGTPYFGYYIPLIGEEGRIIGMAFVGKTRKMVMDAVAHTILAILLCVSAVGLMAAAGAMLYARKIVYSLDKTKEFLGSIARGNVEEDMDPAILSRNDEIGEMGNFAVVLKSSINQLVSTDPLTGLYNRRTCEVILQNVLREYDKYRTPSVVAIGDIDLFKHVNDTYGHQAGDAVLKELAALFREHMERKGVVARWGGEEFMFIYERMDTERVKIHLEELTELICSDKIVYNGNVLQVTMTFGAAACTEGMDMEGLIRKADDHLYYGKRHGRNQVVL